MNYYISVTGNDKNSGSKESPFKTIGRARDEVRKINCNMSSDIIIYIREGIYELEASLEFDQRDSGTNGFHVIYRAYEDEKVIISGGRKVTGWKKSSAANLDNLWEVELPGLKYTRHLYVNGLKAERPKSEVVVTHAWDKAVDETMEFWGYKQTVTNYVGELKVYEGYKTTRKYMAEWKNQRDIEFVYDVGWTHSICPVEEIIPEEDGAVIRMKMPCFKDCQIKAGVQIGAPSYVENVFELMKNPGEWYFDRETHTLYYLAKCGEDIGKQEIIVPVLDKLLEVKGTLGQPVKNILFQKLEFCYSTCLTPSESGHAELQANLVKDPDDDINAHSYYKKIPSAVILDAAHGIELSNCRFYRLGSGAIDIQNGSQSNIIRGNEFYRIDASGIQLGNFNFSDAHPEDERKIVKDNIIDNNYLHKIGEGFKGAVGVLAGYTQGTVITHNEICEVAYTGISVGWGWGYCDPDSDFRYTNLPPAHYPRFTEPTICKNNRIEYNHVHHVMQKLHDGGGIYTLSLQPGSTIIGNHIHDNGVFEGTPYYGDLHTEDINTYSSDIVKYLTSRGGFPGGIYLDEASGGFEVTGNVIYNTAVPCNYHNVGMKNRIRTNFFHDNYYNLKPDEFYLVEAFAKKAGLEEEFLYLKSQTQTAFKASLKA